MLVLVFSCKKKDVDPTVGFSVAVQKVAPQATIDALRKLGMTINEGTVPPNVTGIFLESPTILFATYTGDTYSVGHKVADYTYKFFEPSADNMTIKVSYKASNSDNATGLGSVVAGNGNKFTIFSELTNTNGVVYINVISGEMTSTGIKDWQDSYVKKTELEKNRIFKDGDGFSERVSSFRIGVQEATMGRGKADH
ncbi:MAG: hypothetical protein EAZ70_12830 [Runella slithyformis]|nr:MAG: hypothetical protein EAY79_13075 [Runella slithyformis]TAF23532.1 MAG: hypothetical protein EAZ70_12830 [Runella slithyformis]TAF43596.1 MAG: hypothetical protein EAZ63_13620 [Runella slithyformis]TAF78818.1 MAG: hypothetical protein EAZ50_13035 [Runella slithyformis]